MACPDFSSATLHSFVRYALARMTTPPPRITQWYGGSVIGWTNERSEAFMYATASSANAVRAALGSGVVVQVYDTFGGGLIGQF